MKSTNLRNAVIALLIILSLASFIYLNYSLAPVQELGPEVLEADSAEQVGENSILADVIFIKEAAKKLIELITISFS